jgi:CheY-like chemotaxis protein
MTASSDEKDFEKMKAVGMNNHLMKPLDIDLLVKEILLYK